MKILFVLPRIVLGGVERVTLNLIVEFNKAGHECSLALRHARGDLLDEARALVAIHELAPRGLHQFVPQLAKLIKSWQPTHVVTAFADVAAMTWAAMRLAQSHARWVHGVHSTHASVTAREDRWGKPRFWLDNRLAAFVYRKADSVVAVSNGIRDEIVSQFHIAPEKVETIYNPVIPDDEMVEVEEPRHPPDLPFTIAAIGRLTRQKGFDILIEAMRDVPPSWRLDIWGEGEDRASLQRLIEQFGLQSSIKLRGYTNNPYAVLRSADLFVLTSRWEGFGNVLAEALVCQCQIVAVDCPHGPREILRGGDLGQLVPTGDITSLSEAIRNARLNMMPADVDAVRTWTTQFTNRVSSESWLRVLERA